MGYLCIWSFRNSCEIEVLSYFSGESVGKNGLFSVSRISTESSMAGMFCIHEMKICKKLISRYRKKRHIQSKKKILQI